MYAISEILPLKPDCVLVDFQMSVMDGMELCRELRKHTKLQKTKILMLSVRTDAHWQETANADGADGHLTKPINVETFVTDIEQAL
jgi:CheY-like chemotaxis protein